jgi:hypothetical protein
MNLVVDFSTEVRNLEDFEIFKSRLSSPFLGKQKIQGNQLITSQRYK